MYHIVHPYNNFCITFQIFEFMKSSKILLSSQKFSYIPRFDYALKQEIKWRSFKPTFATSYPEY